MSALIVRPVFGRHRRPDGSGQERGDLLSFGIDADRLVSDIFGWDGPGHTTRRLGDLRSMEHVIPAIQAARLANPQETMVAQLKLMAGVMPDEQIATTVLSASPEEIQMNGAYYAILIEELMEREISSRLLGHSPY